MTVAEGEVVGFLGPNGAGKSTTIRCLLGLYRPTSGTARILGADPQDSDRTLLADVGYLPGELSLPETLSGGDILHRFGRMRGMTDTSLRDTLVERLDVAIKPPINTLSKGNKQKIGIVAAFMHRPKLLVLDEPTSGLDPLLQELFAELIKEATDDGRTVLLSSHDLTEVKRLAKRVVIIRDGQIVVDDTVAAMEARAPGVIELDLDHAFDVTALASVPGVTVKSVTDRHVSLVHSGSVAAALTAIAAMEPTAIAARPAELDELFLQLYRGEGV
ncbi:ABC transporter ATP-binding protein [Gordonia sp. NPDC003585]|uniref:ABC transporter ATP-binding protein n=1 Tax=Gordonia sp. NPDC003585 TaxID=3154275 RepID=UPI00339F046D